MIKDRLVSDINIEKIEEYLFNIASYDRLSASEGESQAISYIIKELEKENISYKLEHREAILSNPISASLAFEYGGQLNNIKAKTRSFSASSGGEEIKARLIYMGQEELIEEAIDLELSRQNQKQDLLGKIVISESGNPISILDAQNRGALAYIQYWLGEEELIHEGAVNPIWGTPRPDQLEYYPKIPVICINNMDGVDLLNKLKNHSLEVSLTSQVENKVSKIPVLEAFIDPHASKNKEYLLLGSHLDSWYLGATDNATGNAIGLYLAKKFNEIKEKLNFGLRVAWWSGHSNGRYAGSSLYARENYKDLSQSCMAYMNIDMPGLRGASDHRKISSGLEIFDLAQECIEEIVDQKGQYSGPVRGWDQSFQNIGITPYFVWSSTLPKGHPDTTGDSFMSWWWHTEEDTIEYYDRDILLKDARIYSLAIEKLLTGDMEVFDLDKLVGRVLKILIKLREEYISIIDLSQSVQEFKDLKASLGRVLTKDLSNKEILYIIKKINQIYYTSGEAYRQDLALDQGEIPGFDSLKFLEKYKDNEYYFNIILNDLLAQENRIISICNQVKILLESKV